MNTAVASLPNIEKGIANFPFGKFERDLARRYILSERLAVMLVSIFSVLSVAVSIALLIVVMSVMNGFRATIMQTILGFDGHVYIDLRDIPKDKADELLDEALGVPDVVSGRAQVEGMVLVSRDGYADGGQVRGVAPHVLNSPQLLQSKIIEGELDSFGRGAKGGNNIVIGWRLAEKFRLRVGDAITLVAPSGAKTPFGVAPRKKSYHVSAIFRVGSAQYDQLVIFMPLEQSQLFFGRKGQYDKAELRISNPQNSEATVKALSDLLKFPDDLGYRRNIRDWKSYHESYLGALVVERNTMGLILNLIVGATGLIIVVCLVLMVFMKRRNIAILRTIGMSMWAVLRVFLIAGLVLGIVAAALGVSIGVGFVIYIDPIYGFLNGFSDVELFDGSVYGLDRLPADLNWEQVRNAGLFGLIVCVLATLPPAFWAAMQDPAEGVKHD